MQTLKRLWNINRRIDELYERIASCRAMATRATASVSATNMSGTSGRSRVETGAIRIMELEEQLDAAIDQLTDERKHIQGAIEQMEDERQKRILELRYIDHLSWEAITRRLFLSPSQSHREHEKALLSFWKFFNSQERWE